MDPQSPIVLFKEPLNAYLLHFSRFPLGTADAVTRIPNNQAGIYFWFRAFNYPKERVGFSNALKKDLEAPKFPTRTGQVKPYFEVSVGSFSGISKGKSKQLDKALEEDTFRDHLRNLLNLSVIFQAPLYIGKSKDIRQRVESHLIDGSNLQGRLSQCQLDIEQTALLVIPMEEYVKLGLDDLDDELLYEEIFSRLFNPLLNLRIG